MTDSPAGAPRRASRPGQQPAQPLPRLQKVVCLLALPLALLLIGLALGMLQAGIASQRAERYLQHWQRLGEPPSPQAWAVARQAAQRAQERYPVANGEYLDRLGRVSTWQPLAPLLSTEGQALRREALGAFRRSLAVRPGWPWTWARLAHAKFDLEELDAEFDLALRRASELGHGRLEVNRDLASLGLLAWNDLNIGQRTLTLEAARRTVTHSPQQARFIYDLARSSGQVDPLCRSLEVEVKARQNICDQESSP
jgi:hypothetical protein